MGEQAVLYERRDSYAVITLNRPEKLNAFNDDLHSGLRDAFSAVAAEDGCRAVLLTGAGRGFCAGQDLSGRGGLPEGERPDLGRSLEKNYNPLIRSIRDLGKPVICAVNGVAAGAGANLALACDIVIAARSASFIQVFSRIGLIPDAGGTWWLVNRLGEARAKALALLAEPLSAKDAAAWGLIWRAVDDENLMAEAEALAARLADGPMNAFGLTKRAIHAASTNTLEAQLQVERETQRKAGLSEEYREGVAAFLEKRPANFRR